MKYLWLALVLLAGGCGPAATAPKPGAPLKHAVPTEESRKMPLENRLSADVVPDHMLGRDWLPGGTLGHYRKGAKEWDLILVKADSPAAAAGWLLDYKKDLEGSKVVPSFGGFYGTDKGRPVFVFTKGEWLAAVTGLPEAEADAVARPFALRIR